MKLTRMAVVAAMLVLPAFLLMGCGDGAAKRSTTEANIQNAKTMIAGLKETFESGQTTRQAEAGGRGDGRLGILTLLVNQNIEYTINKKVSDAGKRQQALEQLEQAKTMLKEQIVPKFEEASQSKSPEDARALVPLMEQLDQQLDKVNEAL